MVGITRSLFVAPKERFSLSFGPDQAIRVARETKGEKEKRRVDEWRVKKTSTTVYLSNLGGEAKDVVLTERIPVSEVEQVQITLHKDHTTGEPEIDDNGFVQWRVPLDGHGHEEVRLVWTMAVAPDVEGLSS